MRGVSEVGFLRMKSHEREARKGCYEVIRKTPHFAGFFMPGACVGWSQVRKY